MHIHNCCTLNVDNLLIKNGTAHKQRTLPQTTINTLKKYEGEGMKPVKNDGGGQMVVVFTITEINYLTVSLF